jgi:hypothetical protein
MGGMAWEIMSASNFPSIGFFYPSFTPFLMRSPWKPSGKLFTDMQKYVILELPKLPGEDDGYPVWPYLRFFKRRMKDAGSGLLAQTGFRGGD